MPTVAAEITGYCPHCGAAAEPGHCPACGLHVGEAELTGPPLRLVLVQIGPALAAFLLTALVLAGGWYVHVRYGWLRWTPTSWLLAVPHDRSGAFVRELDRRYRAGVLTPRQADTLFDRALTPIVGVRTPHPAGADMNATVRWSFQLPGEWLVTEPAGSVTLDGSQVSTGGPNEHGFDRGGMLSRWRIPGEWLTPGRHELSLDVRLFAVSPGATRKPIRLRRTFAIEAADRPPADFVRGVHAPAGQPLPSDWLAVDVADSPRPRTTLSMSISVARRSAAVAASVYIRPAGAGSYLLCDQVLLRGGDNVRRPLNSPVLRSPTLDGATHVDVRLTPDPAVAVMESDITEYLDEVVELRGVPIRGRAPPPESGEVAG